jgi:hypothetical protein
MIEKSYYTIRKLSDPEPESPPFIVQGVLHSTITLLYGEAKTGKSTLAAALAVALSDGEPEFLGMTITAGRPMSVGIVTGDCGDGDAYASLLRQVTDTDMITVYDVKRPPTRALWDEIRLDVRSAGHDVVIVDNLTAFNPGTLNDDAGVNALYDELDRIAREGAAILLIAHTSEKYGEHGKSRYPMGSSAIRARARWLWYVEKTKGRMLRNAFEGNHGPPHEIVTTPAIGFPSFAAVESASADELAERREQRRRNRTAERLNHNSEIAAFVAAECAGISNKSEIARMIAARFGGEAGTHRNRLRQGAYTAA